MTLSLNAREIYFRSRFNVRLHLCFVLMNLASTWVSCVASFYMPMLHKNTTWLLQIQKVVLIRVW